MEKLNICTWLWGVKYDKSYVNRLYAGLSRNINQPFNFMVFSPAKEDEHLTKIAGCFARLRMFDHNWLDEMGIEPGERLACLDLDVVVTNKLDETFNRDEPFVILQGANASNPCPYNGSIMMIRAGYAPEVWKDFSLEAARKAPYDSFPDDQGWLHHKLPNAAGWTVGKESGIYAFQKPGWPKGFELPTDARLVVFPGWRDPKSFAHLSWIKKNWTEDAL